LFISDKLTIPNKIKEFLDNQIQYYITEAQSYKEMAQEYSPKVDSVQDTAFGIIVGCIYSSFLQVYTNQKQTVNSNDMQEFTEIIMINARMIKDAIIGKNELV
jgi:hypothetical protein